LEEAPKLTMHSYANDSLSRGRIVGFLALASWPLHSALSGIVPELSQWAGFSLGIPSVLGLFYLLYWGFRTYLWRLGASVGAFNLPNLNGTWTGTLQSSHDENFEGELNFTLCIEQQWDQISVEAQTDTSRSESTSAFLESDRSGSKLTYTYQNRPKPSTEDSMATHEGTARLRLEDGDRLVGRYYTGEGRGNYGEIEVTRRSEGWLS
jgi:hypothetical protein